MPLNHYRNINVSFNTKDNNADIFINAKCKKNINIRLSSNSADYILITNLSKYSIKNNKEVTLDLFVNEKSNKGRRTFVLHNVGRAKKIINSNDKYKYQIHYNFPLKNLDSDLSGSEILNFDILRPNKRGRITIIGLSTNPFISIGLSIICVLCFGIYFKQVKE